MKFTLLTQAVVAISPITGVVASPTPDVVTDALLDKRADCSMTIKYVKTWVESGLDRYRHWLITEPRDDSHLDFWCEAVQHGFYFTNRQCFWGDDGKYYVDVSVARGPAGHKYLMDTYNGACQDFERLTECKAIKQF
ncbi:hypothetical protein FLAG1_07403 [Fusarium langsethiae]|uniref:Uncharacterized protein n=1 Tax=Fusarium langsethiae TaxID=179993 RepID=A0A0M9ETT2_FUSLA|nr:hypothetical protein FLAG1_07403 [Fusarium langsethiae]GKU06913.1 unnamed protein product [Fusarium langsethiae]GKU21985.1 unnamed protein product [Fusarium langsethiae]